MHATKHLPLTAALLLLGCPSDPSDPAWFTTCGDPVCSSYGGPFDDVPLCTDEELGGSCPSEGATCDPVSDCNALLICATEDPKEGEGGCPISRLAVKRDVHYLGVLDLERLHTELLGLKLATWHYRWDADTDATQLGFIIDDDPRHPGVRPDQRQVDLYGLTSLALAGVQAQAATLSAQATTLSAQAATIQAQAEALEATQARLDALETELSALRVLPRGTR